MTRNREHRVSGLTGDESTGLLSTCGRRSVRTRTPLLALGQGGFRMSTRMHRAPLQALQLPPEFEDLTGVIHNDLKVIVSILTERATERCCSPGDSLSSSSARSGTVWPRPSTRAWSRSRWNIARQERRVNVPSQRLSLPGCSTTRWSHRVLGVTGSVAAIQDSRALHGAQSH